MPPLLQHILALAIVAVCLAYLGWQIVRVLRGKRGSVGNCCAKGCEAQRPVAPNGTTRIAYIPADALRRRTK